VSEKTTVPKMLTSDKVLDDVLDQVDTLLSGVFWNAPPRIVLDEENLYEDRFSSIRVPLDPTDDGAFKCRAREATFLLLSKIASNMNRPNPLAIGPNEHVLVFRTVPLPDPSFKPDGRMVSIGRCSSRRLNISLAWYWHELIAEYKVDYLGRETQRIERCRKIR
jgi:hypothetical protein